MPKKKAVDAYALALANDCYRWSCSTFFAWTFFALTFQRDFLYGRYGAEGVIFSCTGAVQTVFSYAGDVYYLQLNQAFWPDIVLATTLVVWTAVLSLFSARRLPWGRRPSKTAAPAPAVPLPVHQAQRQAEQEAIGPVTTRRVRVRVRMSLDRSRRMSAAAESSAAPGSSSRLSRRSRSKRSPPAALAAAACVSRHLGCSA